MFKITYTDKVHEFYFTKKNPMLPTKNFEFYKSRFRFTRHKTNKTLPNSWRIKFYMVEKKIKKSAIIDNDKIICRRRKYLRTIKQYLSEGRSFFYLDKTWVKWRTNSIQNVARTIVIILYLCLFDHHYYNFFLIITFIFFNWIKFILSQYI